MTVRTPPDEQPTDTSDDIPSDAGSALDQEIEIVLDRWSVQQVDWADLLAAGAVLLVAAVIAYLIRTAIRRSSRNIDGTGATAMSLVGQLVSVGIYAFAFAIALEILGFTLGPVLIIVALAFILLLVFRPVIENLTSGLFLQLRGFCRPGDIVSIDGSTGRVDEVNARSVVLETIDGRTVFLPNDRVIEGKVVNYSRLGRRRSHITVRLAPHADVDTITTDVLRVVSEIDLVLENPAPALVVTGFDGPQIWAEVHYWTAPEIETEIAARDEVGRALAKLFAAGAGPVDGSSVVYVKP